MAFWVLWNAFNKIFRDVLSGSIWESLFGVRSGLPYLVFNIQSQVVAIWIALFAILCSMTFWFWVHSKVTGLSVVDAYREKTKFFKSPFFWAVLVFDILFVVLGGLNIMSYTGITFDGMLGDDNSGPLILVLFGPLILFCLFGVGIGVLLGAVAVMAMYFLMGKMVIFMADYARNFYPEFSGAYFE